MSFVEKAWTRMKRPEREMAPLGKLVAADEPAPEPKPQVEVAAAPATEARPEEAPAFGTPPQTAADEKRKKRVGGKKVSVDRDRLREEGFLAPEKYQRQMADEYRRIKRPLIANAFGLGVPQVEIGNLILVSSAISGEGKTHTCLNLALSLSAERDRTVLLVDGDVPKPHVSRLFGVAEQPGLLDLLGDHPPRLESLLIKTDIPRLSVLPAGQWTDHAPELLASGRMQALCMELSRRYPDRIVLFDSPPLLAATEAQAISAHVGQVVLVIAENVTARDDVRAALGLLDENKPINAILNKSRRGSAGGYYGGYGYGYGAHAGTHHEAADAPRS